MKDEIKKRMEAKIGFAKKSNELFSEILEVVELELSNDATKLSDDEYMVQDENLRAFVRCNESTSGTVSINIDYKEQGTIASVNIDLNGSVQDSYFNMPTDIRREINDLVYDICKTADDFNKEDASEAATSTMEPAEILGENTEGV